MRNRCTIPLSKAKVRQSWSKYNLYNLSRLRNPHYRGSTFFQLKWKAKSILRAYHGEQVREKQWERMFSRRLKAVVPMNPTYLARNDGSLESAGRGSGLELRKPMAKPQPIPYMQMTFAPLERRLDTAIFRALFASSARQARQFVVHGAVKVNGKKMIYPGYLLNPGDMFQVDPERVMFATGAPKDKYERLESRRMRKATASEKDTQASEDGEEAGGIIEETESSSETEDAAAEPSESEPAEDPRKVLKSLIAQTKSILSSPRENVGAKRKQDIRAFQKSLKRTLSRSTTSTILTDSLEAQFLELQNLLSTPRDVPQLPSEQKPTPVSAEEADKPPGSSETASPRPSQGSASESDTGERAREEATAAAKQAQAEAAQERAQEAEDFDISKLPKYELEQLKAAMRALQENPIDPSKPYATPWRPRDYMSAFAFIPRYLEVNQNICAAVYLRHPVARPGLSEVPSPYGEVVSGTAFAWYLRRR